MISQMALSRNDKRFGKEEFHKSLGNGRSCRWIKTLESLTLIDHQDNMMRLV